MVKILIVEDEQATSNMYATLLKTEGFKVLQAGKGMEGYSLAIKENPNLILLDYRLPDINGFELLKLLQKNSEKKIPVLIITNYAADLDQDAIHAAGAKEILFKYNMTPSSLLKKIKQYLSAN